MNSFMYDLRHATRSLAKTPRFTAIVVLTLALAIGATTAVFSIVNGVLLDPLGFADPGRLVYIQATSPTGSPMSVSPQDLSDFRDRTHSFTGVAAVDGGRSMNLTRATAPALRISAARVGAPFFSILGVRAAHGRTFAPNEDASSAPRVVVLSDAAWKREFGGDPRIIGRRITLDGNSYEVVGVAPPSFTFPANPDLWYPAVWRDWEIGDTHRGYHAVFGIARLRPGVTVAGASADLQSVAAAIARDFPQYDAKVGAMATSLREQIVGNVERPLWTMLGAVAFVLLIACANVGNLLLVRASSRESELAVRTALGASHGRLLQQLFAESIVLAASGAALGTLAAGWVIDAVVAFGPLDLPRLRDVRLDLHVLAFTGILMVVVGVAFGMLPGVVLARSELTQRLRSGARGLTGARSRLRSSLVLAELALATVLVVSAGLLIKSFDRLVSVNPGFNPEHLVVFDVALSEKKYEYDAATNQFTDDVQRRLAALPGTRSVAVTADRPIDPNPGFEASTSFTVDGAPTPPKGLEPESAILPVSPSFFSTMGMSLVHGRTFSDAEDRLDVAPVVVVNRALVDRYFRGENPIGKHLTFGLSHNFTSSPADSVRAHGEIVGVVENVHQRSLSGTPEPATYFPFHTLPFAPTFVVRTDADPVSVQREIRTQLAAIDRDVPLYELGTMSAALSESVAQPRFYTLLLTAFAGVALLLAILGIYGVISYAVAQRTREFGIRLALGATASDIVRLVTRRGLLLAGAGIGIGIAAAMGVTRSMQSLLFHVDALDPIVFVFGGLALALAAILGSWIPARRAANADPVMAMRAE